MRKRVNLSGIVLSFGIFMGVAVSVSAGMPTVTLSPKVVKVGDEITVTISPNGWTLKTGPTLAGSATGELSASGGTLTTTGSGYITVDTTWERPDGQGGEESASVTGTATVVYVALEPVAMGNKPDLEPGRMCLNAQQEYKKAKWKATVLPEGTTAKIEYCSLVTGSAETSGGEFEVTPAGASVGKYKITLKHSLLESCEAEGEETVFELRQEVIYNNRVTEDFVWREDFVTGRFYPPLYDGVSENVNTSRNEIMNFKSIARKNPLSIKVTGAEFTIKPGGEFGLLSNPIGAYNGRVIADVASDFTGSIALNDGSTGSYQIAVRLDGKLLYAKAAHAAGAWADRETAINKSFTCDVLNGTIFSTGCHTCSQRGGLDGTRNAEVINAVYTILLSNFRME